MESAQLRRKDTTKGPPLRVLSLDGGGVRGYSMLILIQELMYRTYVEIEGKAPRRDQIPKPCDHFDLIAGTGTGGLIAIMLGRLRLDLETCKEVYVRMTRKVFETDKTFAGIPYRSTLFKASKLEEAIRECVRDHTVSEEEGNDGTGPQQPTPFSASSQQTFSPADVGPQRTMSRASNVSNYASPYRPSFAAMKWGNPNSYLYDNRDFRTKTAVFAVYKGSKNTSKYHGNSALLRSYDSRKEPAPEFNCTIWQAGRATSATGLAFKPIQIGQSVFIDEGSGKYNPSPQVLDEACVNEWPGRDVGIFISVGTGKRPSGSSTPQHEWWEGFVSSQVGDFAEARRRLVAKIEGCEETHQYMVREHLSRRRVNPENYIRLNVEVGVGDFGMNEWSRLADISTSTRRYLGKSETQRMNVEAASRLARIHRARLRNPMTSNQGNTDIPPVPPPSNPLAVELSGDDRPITPTRPPPSYSTDEKYTVISSDEFPEPVPGQSPDQLSPHPPRQTDGPPVPRRSHELDTTSAGSPHRPPRSANGSVNPSPRPSTELPPGPYQPSNLPGPPPLPPKTPLPLQVGYGRRPQQPLPYPDDDGPPPAVDYSRKPQYGGR
ncbi:MAG: hypothetical protein M1814_005012 [Vezdaea aestivalis]|nr:MAG: hypothetical protein M1814_005012 [Vezdaea aestivalis]